MNRLCKPTNITSHNWGASALFDCSMGSPDPCLNTELVVIEAHGSICSSDDHSGFLMNLQDVQWDVWAQLDDLDLRRSQCERQLGSSFFTDEQWHKPKNCEITWNTSTTLNPFPMFRFGKIIKPLKLHRSSHSSTLIRPAQAINDEWEVPDHNISIDGSSGSLRGIRQKDGLRVVPDALLEVPGS